MEVITSLNNFFLVGWGVKNPLRYVLGFYFTNDNTPLNVNKPLLFNN